MGIPGFTALRSVYVSTRPWFSFIVACGGLGQRCCEAPYQNLAAFGPLVSCDQGLGCDVTTNTCVAPCGGTGQPCCDGPQTRAPKWTTDGRVYSPNSWDMQEMCSSGACDKASHRCFTCGITDMAPCCPPDAAQATARCFGPDLECQFNPWGFYDSGTCVQCGIRGRKPCEWGCHPGLGRLNGLCDLCGDNLQAPCDGGTCKPGLGRLGGLCRHCGNVNQVPCDQGCFGGLKPRNGLCAVCGAINQLPCDSGCNPGSRLVNGTCRQCGYTGQVPCEGATPCVYPMKVAGGVCRMCGTQGLIPCDSGCASGLTVANGLCATPQAPPPVTCASIGEQCVPNSQRGTHCCQHVGANASCVFGTCKACIPHGEVVPPFGTQICCEYADSVVIDPFTGNAVCDVPDVPDK